MSEARAHILARVRTGLAAGPDDEARRAAVAARLSAHARATLPARSAGGAAARIALFAEMAGEADASVASVAAPDDVPAAVAAWLQAGNLPASARMGADPLLEAIDWTRAPMLQIARGAAEEPDTAGLSLAAAAAAETGTVVMASGPDNPTSLNFLPQNHIVVVPASRIHDHYEDAWAALRAAHGAGALPRAVNLVTGPSRTADIEQTLLMGAHGPKRLHIIVVQGA